MRSIRVAASCVLARVQMARLVRSTRCRVVRSAIVVRAARHAWPTSHSRALYARPAGRSHRNGRGSRSSPTMARKRCGLGSWRSSMPEGATWRVLSRERWPGHSSASTGRVGSKRSIFSVPSRCTSGAASSEATIRRSSWRENWGSSSGAPCVVRSYVGATPSLKDPLVRARARPTSWMRFRFARGQFRHSRGAWSRSSMTSSPAARRLRSALACSCGPGRSAYG